MENFEAAIKAFAHGAAIVYHELVAVISDATEWYVTHPDVQPFVNSAITTGNALLVSYGFPAASVTTAETLVLSALKTQAANDATVASINPK